MTIPTQPSLLQTGRTPNELQDLMSSNGSQVEGVGTTAYNRGEILLQHSYGAHDQLGNNAYVPPHAWARMIPSELAMGYAPSHSASGSNHSGNAYLPNYTVPGTMTFPHHMTHTPFNSASGSNHLNDTMNAMYHQAGRKFTPPHRYEPQANQNLAFMGINPVPHHFPSAETLDRPPYERIYYPGATGNPAVEAFRTRSANSFAGPVDQFSYPGFEDRSVVEGVPAFPPTIDNAPGTGYPGGPVDTYGVGERDAEQQPSSSNFGQNTGGGAEITQHSHLLDAFLNISVNPDWTLISVLDAQIGQPSNAHTDEHASGEGYPGDQINSVGEGHQDSLPQASLSNDPTTGEGSAEDRDFDAFFGEISNFDRDFELHSNSDAQTGEQPNVHRGELVSQVNDMNEPQIFGNSSDDGDSGENTEVTDVPQAGVEPEWNMHLGENWNFDFDFGFLDLPAWPENATFGAQIHSTDEEAGAVHNNEPGNINNNGDGSRNVEEQTESPTPTQNERLDNITNLSVATQRPAPDRDTSIASASGKGKKRAIANVDFDEGAHEETQSSSRKRSSTERMDESSIASHNAAVPSGSSTRTANATNSTQTSPVAGPSNWQAEASPAAHSTEIASGDAPPAPAAASPQTHTGRSAAKPQAQARTEPLRCDICVATANGRRVATYKRPAELNRHVREKHIIGKLPCPHCGFKGSNSYALRRHILKLHGFA